VGICIWPYLAPETVDRGVTVKLQQNTGSWVDVAGATVTLTRNQLFDSVVNPNADGWFVVFRFPTPIAVDTNANKWRFASFCGRV
jgi:hypothetical protein